MQRRQELEGPGPGALQARPGSGGHDASRSAMDRFKLATRLRNLVPDEDEPPTVALISSRLSCSACDAPLRSRNPNSYIKQPRLPCSIHHVWAEEAWRSDDSMNNIRNA